jgi:hypothetical protein
MLISKKSSHDTIPGSRRTTKRAYATAARTLTWCLKMEEGFEKTPLRQSMAMKRSEMPRTAPCL